ncbi:hypothetical protein B484DRAFT_434867, partial [Ochromonadaceae sp. CCMP2298]
MGFCTTHQYTTLKFLLTNEGEIEAPFQWDSPYPFMRLCMPRRPSATWARVCMPLYPTLSSKPTYRHRFDGDRDEVFGVTPKAGVVPPLGAVSVQVSYSALAMGCFSLDRYAFRTPGGCDAILTCSATSTPPLITLCKEAVTKPPKFPSLSPDTGTSLSPDTGTFEVNGAKFREAAPEFSLNFRDVEVGKAETRILMLRNESERPTPFSVIADEAGTFQMFPKQGVIPAHYKAYPVKVVFRPTRAINFYRRFFMLVGDGLPLFYDCLGTGYVRAKGEVKEQRPAPLRHAHVQAYRNRSAQGVGGLSPDELDRIYEEGGLALAQTGGMGGLGE